MVGTDHAPQNWGFATAQGKGGFPQNLFSPERFAIHSEDWDSCFDWYSERRTVSIKQADLSQYVRTHGEIIIAAVGFRLGVIKATKIDFD